MSHTQTNQLDKVGQLTLNFGTVGALAVLITTDHRVNVPMVRRDAVLPTEIVSLTPAQGMQFADLIARAARQAAYEAGNCVGCTTDGTTR